MERRRALAAASAATLVLGSTIVAAASVTGASLLGFGGSGHGHPSVASATNRPGVVVRTRNVYDRYVVDTGTASTDLGGSSGGTGATSDTVGAPYFTATTIANPGGDQVPPASTPTRSRRGDDGTPSRTPTTPPDSQTTTPTTSAVTPTTTPPTTPTTVATTPTTWPVGVPSDWPKNKPIPPMPPNCQQPQLEDNGVWNCDH